MTSALFGVIKKYGSISFDQFQAEALYGEKGFFSTNWRPGRFGSFLTSPTLGDVFGRVLARALDEWWDELGQPSRFQFVDCGAGDGSLARSLLSASMRCAAALEYVAVEISPISLGQLKNLGERHQNFSVSDRFPDSSITGVVFANELLDNLPVRLFERTPDGWSEVRVGLSGNNEFVEVLEPGELPIQFDTAVEIGRRVPVQSAVANWFRDAMGIVQRGRVVCIDYARSTDEMARLDQAEWLRTYADHHPGTHPLRRVGKQDITCDVAIDQLQSSIDSLEIEDQADFLRRHGIFGFVEPTHSDADVRKLMEQRSLKSQVQALLDPEGLGGFKVIQRRIE